MAHFYLAMVLFISFLLCKNCTKFYIINWFPFLRNSLVWRLLKYDSKLSGNFHILLAANFETKVCITLLFHLDLYNSIVLSLCIETISFIDKTVAFIALILFFIAHVLITYMWKLFTVKNKHKNNELIHFCNYMLTKITGNHNYITNNNIVYKY